MPTIDDIVFPLATSQVGFTPADTADESAKTMVRTKLFMSESILITILLAKPEVWFDRSIRLVTFFI